jgi:hypothetical protein
VKGLDIALLRSCIREASTSFSPFVDLLERKVLLYFPLPENEFVNQLF